MLEKTKAATGDINPSSSKRVKISEGHNIEFEISSKSQPKGVFQKRNQLDDDEDADAEDLEPLNKRRSKSFNADVYESDEDVDGPDSDEDTDEEEEKDAGKGKSVVNGKGKADVNDEEDEDMFGDDSAASKKKIQFLKSNDIEGQEWNNLENENEEEGDIPTESFNMDQELAEGDFTQSGVYIRKIDEQSIHDSWLHGIGKKEIQKAQQAHQALLKKEKEAEQLQQQLNPDKSLSEIFHLLQPSENILSAIKRLGAGSTTVPKWKKPKKNANKKGAQELTPEEIAENKNKLDIITSLATSLFDTNTSIYEMTYQDIALHLQRRNMI